MKTHNTNPEYELHQFAEFFPPMSEIDVDTLAMDIKENGVRDEITLYHGKILDGKNRYEQARRLGVPFRTTEFVGDDDAAMRFVISKNLARRQMTESQRAYVTAELLAVRTGRKTGDLVQDPDAKPYTGNKTEERQRLAELMNIGVTTVQRVEKVMEHAIPEVNNAVKNGSMSVNAAHKLVGLSPDEQKKVVENPPERLKPKRSEVGKKIDAGEADGRWLEKNIKKMEPWLLDIPAMAETIVASSRKIVTHDDGAILGPLCNNLRREFEKAVDACKEATKNIMKAEQGNDMAE